ncbi:MAG: transporter substrate-binding domain-containing protein [Deltaproteobacteria bacterium]|nr:transporter substrate-binding domain-containing protein [Deltaproteobacteria bacterium]
MVYRTTTVLGLALALGCSAADAQPKPAEELYDMDTATLPAPAAGSPLDRMIKSLHARVCIRVDVAPFGYFGSGAGPAGFDVALAAEIVDQLGIDYKVAIKPEWVVVTAGERVRRVQDDACDFSLSAFSYTRARAAEVATSKVYARTDKVLVAQAKITRKRPVIGKLEGTTGDTGIAGDERTFRTYQEIIHAMDGGDIDYLAADRPIAEHLVRSTARPYTVAKTLAANAESYVVAIRKGNADLVTAVDRALETIARTGRLALLERRWL